MPESEFITVEEGRVRFQKRKTTIHWNQYFYWQVWINQTWRDAELLSVLGSRFLFAWEDKKGKVLYAEIGLEEDGKFSDGHKNISAKNPPVAWRHAVARHQSGL